MKELEKYRSKLIGKKLIKVLHTDQGKGVEHLVGLGNTYYFSTVLELEGGERFGFSDDWIEEWSQSKRLREVTHRNWRINKNIIFRNV